MAMMVYSTSNTYGILKANTKWAFYHPLSTIYSKQKDLQLLMFDKHMKFQNNGATQNKITFSSS